MFLDGTGLVIPMSVYTVPLRVGIRVRLGPLILSAMSHPFRPFFPSPSPVFSPFQPAQPSSLLSRSSLFRRILPASPSLPTIPSASSWFGRHITKRIASGSRGRVFKSAFLPLKPCKNARPEITPNPSLIHLRFNISLSSIDRYPPFRAKRQSKGPDNKLLKTDHRISRSEPPSRAPGPG